jgi:hypothetical protein
MLTVLYLSNFPLTTEHKIQENRTTALQWRHRPLFLLFPQRHLFVINVWAYEENVDLFLCSRERVDYKTKANFIDGIGNVVYNIHSMGSGSRIGNQLDTE